MLFRHQTVCWGFVFALVTCCCSYSMGAENESSLNTMPVREVTVFKDGHAFVHHEGEVKTDANGNVHLDYLPSPVLGTFWSYSADEKVKLKSVTAGKQRVQMKRTALTLIELIKANIGAEAIIQEQAASKESKPLSYHATILSIPTRSAKEIETASPFASGPHLPVQGSTLLLKTKEGIRIININTIRNITLLKQSRTKVQHEEIRTRLRLNLDWGNKKPSAKTKIGMTYLQKGIRWIPQYNLTINDNGTIKVQLQATLINELTDLNDVTANLLVGVPHIEFKETLDPIAMHQQGVQLSSYFYNAPASGGRSMLRNNAIMSQQAFSRRYNTPHAVGVKLPHSEKNGEMFSFQLKHISLAKGERMIVSVGEWTMKYKNVYKLYIPSISSSDARRYFKSYQSSNLEKAIDSPKVKKTLRIVNNQQAPFTTAPVLIQSSKGLVGQGMMTYTAAGGTVDIVIATAVNVPIYQEENVTGQLMNNLVYNRNHYNRTKIKCEIKITNFNKKKIQLEVTRMTIGKADSAEEEGRITHPTTHGYWANQLNTHSQIDWKKTLLPGETIQLHHKWHYFWN